MENIRLNNVEQIRQRREEIEREIEKKKSKALTKDEFERYTGLIEQYKMRRFNDLLPSEVEEYLSMDRAINDCSLNLKNLPELNFVLDKIGSKKEILAHENAHANKASSLEAIFVGYKVTLLQDGIKYQTQVFLPKDWPKEKQNSALREIINAPDEYGVPGGSSNSDKKKLKNIEEGNK